MLDTDESVRTLLFSDRVRAVSGMIADLHVHSEASDGLLAPTDVVRRAAAIGLERIALTDHDVTSGLDEAIDAGERLGVDVIAGVELTVRLGRRVAHLLGYGINRRNTQLSELLGTARRAMSEHVDAVLVELHAEGVVIDRTALARLHSRYPTGTSIVLHLTRNRLLPRLANPWRILRMAAAQPVTASAEDAIKVIQAAGGLAVLAHPGKPAQSRPPIEDAVIEELAEAGLDGLEAWHHAHRAEVGAHYAAVAERLDLLVTAGSDSHGRDGGTSLGTQTLEGIRLTNFDLALRRARDAQS